MLLFGDDFEFDNLQLAFTDFNHIESIIEYAKENLDVEVKWSTPSEFLDSVRAKKLEVK
jgi:hypothetical protein